MLKPNLVVGVFESGVKSIFAAILLSFFVGPVVPIALTALVMLPQIPVWTIAVVAVLGPFILVFGGVVVHGIAKYYTSEYRIYSDQVEVKHGILSEEYETIPRSKIHHVKATSGIVEKFFETGDLHIKTSKGKADITLQNISNVEDWYEEFAPVSFSSPLKTVPMVALPKVLQSIPGIVLLVSVFSPFVLVGAVFISPFSLILTGGIVGATAVAVAVALVLTVWINARNYEYRFFSDHIESHRSGVTLERECVVTSDIKGVEYERGILDRFFDVGTISLNMKYRGDEFDLSSIGDSKAIYDKLRNLT